MSIPMKTSSAYLLLLTLVPAGYVVAAGIDSTAVSPKELSVAPLDHVEYPESRPQWVTDRPVSDGELFRAVIVSGPCESVEESLEELKLMQRAAISSMVIQIAQSDGRFDFFSPSDEVIAQDFVTRSYQGEVTQGAQTRYEHAVEVAFTESQQQQVKQAWKDLEVRDRLGALGVVTFSGLVLLICGSAMTGLVSRRVQRQDKADPAADSRPLASSP